jgi:putative membrane protein
MPASPSSLKAFLLGAAPGPRRPFLNGALIVFAGCIGFSLAGMLLLWFVPASMAFFGPYLNALIVTPTWVYMTLLALLPVVMYGPLVGWKRVAIFAVLGCVIGGGSELVGTNLGFPFGEYHYDERLLGPKILGDVPYFIPPSWFAMSLLSLDLAQRVTGRSANTRWRRILLATAFMVLWDVSLDPAMNGAGAIFGDGFVIGGADRFWTYPPAGPEEFKFYYGMPFSNWVGWFGVTFVIVCAYEFVAGGLRTESRYAPLVYLLNCLFPLALCAMYGLWVPAVVGTLATALPLAAAYRVHRTEAELARSAEEPHVEEPHVEEPHAAAPTRS